MENTPLSDTSSKAALEQLADALGIVHSENSTKEVVERINKHIELSNFKESEYFKGLNKENTTDPAFLFDTAADLITEDYNKSYAKEVDTFLQGATAQSEPFLPLYETGNLMRQTEGEAKQYRMTIGDLEEYLLSNDTNPAFNKIRRAYDRGKLFDGVDRDTKITVDSRGQFKIEGDARLGVSKDSLFGLGKLAGKGDQRFSKLLGSYFNQNRSNLEEVTAEAEAPQATAAPSEGKTERVVVGDMLYEYDPVTSKTVDGKYIVHNGAVYDAETRKKVAQGDVATEDTPAQAQVKRPTKPLKYTPEAANTYGFSDVKSMQEMLEEAGYSVGSYGADGKYGRDTDAALSSAIDELGELGFQNAALAHQFGFKLDSPREKATPVGPVVNQPAAPTPNFGLGPAVTNRQVPAMQEGDLVSDKEKVQKIAAEHGSEAGLLVAKYLTKRELSPEDTAKAEQLWGGSASNSQETPAATTETAVQNSPQQEQQPRPDQEDAEFFSAEQFDFDKIWEDPDLLEGGAAVLDLASLFLPSVIGAPADAAAGVFRGRSNHLRGDYSGMAVDGALDTMATIAGAFPGLGEATGAAKVLKSAGKLLSNKKVMATLAGLAVYNSNLSREQFNEGIATGFKLASGESVSEEEMGNLKHSLSAITQILTAGHSAKGAPIRKTMDTALTTGAKATMAGAKKAASSILNPKQAAENLRRKMGDAALKKADRITQKRNYQEYNSTVNDPRPEGSAAPLFKKGGTVKANLPMPEFTKSGKVVKPNTNQVSKLGGLLEQHTFGKGGVQKKSPKYFWGDVVGGQTDLPVGDFKQVIGQDASSLPKTMAQTLSKMLINLGNIPDKQEVDFHKLAFEESVVNALDAPVQNQFKAVRDQALTELNQTRGTNAAMNTAARTSILNNSQGLAMQEQQQNTAQLMAAQQRQDAQIAARDNIENAEAQYNNQLENKAAQMELNANTQRAALKSSIMSEGMGNMVDNYAAGQNEKAERAFFESLDALRSKKDPAAAAFDQADLAMLQAQAMFERDGSDENKAAYEQAALRQREARAALEGRLKQLGF